MANQRKIDKLAEYSAIAPRKKRKPLSQTAKLIVLLSITAAFLVTAVVVLALFYVGVFDAKPNKGKDKTKTEKEIDPIEGFREYVFNEDDLPSGHYADFTFLCDGKEYAVSFYLFSTYAPNTVSNFMSYVQKAFYNGTAIDGKNLEGENGKATGGFFIGGGMTRNEDGSISVKIPVGGAQSIKGEFLDNGDETNLLSNTAGVIGMIHSPGNPDNATTDFYILPYDNKTLNGKYAAFAKAATEDGLKTLRILAQKAYTGTPVSIKTIKVSEK